MVKFFLNLLKTINSQIQEPQQRQCQRNMQKTTLGHTRSELLKTRIVEKVVRAARGKKMYKDRKI